MVSHWEEHDGGETLITTVSPGSPNPNIQVCIREVCVNSLDDWTTPCHDGYPGRPPLGSGFGKITIIRSVRVGIYALSDYSLRHPRCCERGEHSLPWRAELKDL